MSRTSPSWLEGIGGTVRGSFFRVSDSVDTEKAPGLTTLTPHTVRKATQDILSGVAFFYSPNLTWFVISCVVWCIYPYNIHDESVSLKEQLLERMGVNHAVVLTYFGFWHIGLYCMGWGKRPFAKGRTYNWEKVVHNMFYSELGILQWTMTEVGFLHCYQTGKLPYHHDHHLSTDSWLSFSTSLSWPVMGITCLWCLAVPVIRDFHFYFVHRMIHVHFLYNFVHSVHHRNSDIEPFSGLTMHPIEHLYYFSCYGPLLLGTHHPFVLFWMGTHVCISPAAAHSGYEDHFSASLYHYLHHRYYECNYAAGIQFDKWVGTFRDSLGPSAAAAPAPRDAKSTLMGWPENPLYLLTGLVLPVTILVFRDTVWPGWNPELVASLVAVQPIAAAFGLYRGERPFAPFQKDWIWSQLLHHGCGVMMGVLPVYYLLSIILR